MGECLKTDLESDLTDTEVSIAQQGFGFLDSHFSQILHKRKTSCPFETPTKMVPAYVESASDAFELDGVGIVASYIICSPFNQRRIYLDWLRYDLVSNQGEVGCEDF